MGSFNKMPIIIYALEDDLSNLFLLKRNLSGYEEFSLFLYSNLSSFFSALEDKYPDIILLDLNLGVSSEDGFSVLENLYKADLLDSIPVLVITADIREESIVRAFSLGVMDYIKKPYDSIELVARIKRYHRLFSNFQNNNFNRKVSL